jgi:L-serine dehydratase
MNGGTPEQAAAAAGVALQGLMGLVCDPVGGLVEIPCIMRNATGATVALAAADIALAGLPCYLPCDEVVTAMVQGGTLPAGYPAGDRSGRGSRLPGGVPAGAAA